MQISNTKNILCSVFTTLFLYLFFTNIKAFSQYTFEALNLCYTTVIPSLYIFIVFTTYLSNTEFTPNLSTPFMPFFQLLNIKNKQIASYCLLSIISGFATGGYLISKLKNEYDCSKNMITVLSVLMSNNSPAFVICAVGLNMLGNISSGIILYISMLFSSLTTAFILSVLLPYNCDFADKISKKHNFDLTTAIHSAVSSMLYICGVIITIFPVCKVFQLHMRNIVFSTMLSAISEVTTGCHMIISNCGKNIYLICIALTLCPLSTYFQLKSHCENLNIIPLLLSKIIQIPIALLILRIAINLFPQSFAVYAIGDISVKTYWNRPDISCCMLILSLCFVVFFDKKIGVFTNLHK